jgi:hypothetical protein
VSPAKTLVDFRVLTKHDELPLPYAERLLGICMQSAFNAMKIRKNEVRESAVRLYKYASDLAITMENGADVGFERCLEADLLVIWSLSRRRKGPSRCF